MWKMLDSRQNVNLGDKVRYTGDHPHFTTENLFKVVKAEQHYFEIIPEVIPVNTKQDVFSNKVVRYFDIGYTIGLEVWIEQG